MDKKLKIRKYASYDMEIAIIIKGRNFWVDLKQIKLNPIFHIFCGISTLKIPYRVELSRKIKNNLDVGL